MQKVVLCLFSKLFLTYEISQQKYNNQCNSTVSFECLFFRKLGFDKVHVKTIIISTGSKYLIFKSTYYVLLNQQQIGIV